MTGEWEARLERMRRGDAERDEFMTGIRSFVTELVAQIKQQAPQGARRVFGPVVGTCPKCGSNLHLRDWEGRYYVKCAASAIPPAGCPLIRILKANRLNIAGSARDRSEPPAMAERSAPSATNGKRKKRQILASLIPKPARTAANPCRSSLQRAKDSGFTGARTATFFRRHNPKSFWRSNRAAVLFSSLNRSSCIC